MRKPHEYFGAKEPGDDLRSWYKESHRDCNVWLSGSQDECRHIAEQYTHMNALKENEAKFSFRGKNYFFKEDDLYPSNDSTRRSTLYLLLEWAPNPDGEQLLCPPVVDHEASGEFRFNSNPDCTYWLTSRRFNPEYRKHIARLTYVRPDVDALAPYLTVEFKKDNADYKTAVNQVAVSATLILFNRFRLRMQFLTTKFGGSVAFDERAFEDLEHFGIAFHGSKADFFRAKPRLDVQIPTNPQWKGCEVTQFTTYNANNAEDVVAIQHWINEIHNWGQGKYSVHLMWDVKEILKAAPGGGTRISVLEDDHAMKEWESSVGLPTT